ncbi:MAG: hypothetical protein OQK24_01230 [Magnetovibrio sp.]|nr:hypothetical protein [Magnetovibrio sp.]
MSNSKVIEKELKLADRATLSLLSTLEEGESTTQRGLASRVGVALGFTNSLLKRAVRKGLVKVKEAPTKRYMYYVTPKGFSEKSRLVAQYLSTSLSFFRRARNEYSELYKQAEELGHKRVLLYGVSELAEIAILSAIESSVEVKAVAQAGSNTEFFSGLPILSQITQETLEDFDIVVITCSDNPQAAYDQVCEIVPSERVFAAPLLHIRTPDVKAEEGA